MRLIRETQKLLAAESSLLELAAPIVVVGDIHGQFFDLNNMIKLVGAPSTTQYLFLGDYVDRGCFALECVFYIFALKLNRPKGIHLLRGNHESRMLTSHYNFRRECERKCVAATVTTAATTLLSEHITSLAQVQHRPLRCDHDVL